MTNKEAINWIALLIETMRKETRGNNPDPEYKDEVYEALKMGIALLKAEPCEDAVSRADVKKIAKEMYLEVGKMELDVHTISDCVSYTASKCRQALVDKLNSLPPVLPKQKTGKWAYDGGRDMYDGKWYHIYKCSECGRTVSIDSQQYDKLTEVYPYCHCGAKME